MENINNPRPMRASPTATATVVGTLLILVGIVFLIAQLTSFDLGQYGWPLFVIAPGVLLIAAGVVNRSAAGLAIPGSIVTMTGVILAVQNTFGLWASWSYAWALVFPTSIGIGTVILGLTRADSREISSGLRAMLAGLALFAIFGIFFEGMLHVDGITFGGAGNAALAVILILAGVGMLAWRLISSAGRSSPTV